MTNFHLKTQATGHLLLGANQAGVEEGVGIKLSRGELTAGGLTPVTAAIKHQINHHKPSPHLAATNTKSGLEGKNHLSLVSRQRCRLITHVLHCHHRH